MEWDGKEKAPADQRDNDSKLCEEKTECKKRGPTQRAVYEIGLILGQFSF